MPPPERSARVDFTIGVLLALLAALVLWSARAFPVVPGQKLGAGFLPSLLGAGLFVCGVLLAMRGWRRRHHGTAPAARAVEQVLPALVVVAAVAGYVLAADRLGFLLVAPPLLLAVFRALKVEWRIALPWALAGTLVVHLVFYKLLRVPLPWGVLRPFY